MAHNISREKQARIDRQIAVADRAAQAEVLKVCESAGLGHLVRAKCLCNRSRLVDLEAANRSWGARTWRSVLQEQLLVCRQCGRPAEALAISFAPEPFHTLRRHPTPPPPSPLPKGLGED